MNHGIKILKPFGFEIAIKIVLWKGECVLAFVDCDAEYEAYALCAVCGRRAVLQKKKVFLKLARIIVEAGGKIDPGDQGLLEFAEKDLRARFARDICPVCELKELRRTILANMPKDPLWI